MKNDFESMIRALNVLHQPGEILELRSIEKPTLSGYFRCGDDDTIRRALNRYAGRTFYQTLNPVRPDCYSRSQHDQLIPNPKETTGDGNILYYQWILVDCDPVRASGVSSSETEKLAAKQVIVKVYWYLRKVGFSEPVCSDSGNGYHLLYKVHIPCDKSETVKRFLAALDTMFSCEEAAIDTAVYNASRITKLYGTVASKGADTPDRPHRISSIINIPEPIEPTSESLIKSITDEILPVVLKDKRSKASSPSEAFDLDTFLDRHCRVKKIVPTSNGTRYILEECPFDAAHKDAAVFRFKDGSLAFKCFHNSCSGYHWHEFREHFDPDAYRSSKEPIASITAADMHKLHSGNTADLTQETEPDGSIMLDIAEIPEPVYSPQSEIKSGITLLDKKIGGFRPGEVTVWSGGNGAGKSSLVGQIALYAVDQGHRAAIFSGELTPQRVKNWLYLQAAGRNHVHADPLRPNSWILNKGIRNELDQILRGKIGIYNNEYGNNWETVIQKAIIPFVQTNKSDVVVIDNLMALDIPLRTTNANEAQSQAIKAFSGMAKKLNLHIHFVCHPRKSTSFLRKEDISGSADLTNMADNVMMVHRCGADFFSRCKEFYGKNAPSESDGYGNIIEIMKNRENGVQDELVPLYYEPAGKTMSDVRGGRILFSWLEQLDLIEEVEDIFNDQN